MCRTVIPLIIVLLSVASLRAVAQDKSQDQKPATAAAAGDPNEPKNEVQEMLAEAKKKGDPILGTCLENCVDKAKPETDGFERGQALELVKPRYPAIARAAHVEGMVEVQVILDENGQVIRAAAISGHPLLQAASVEAARNSSFSASKLDGKPVKVVGVLQYNFIAQ